MFFCVCCVLSEKGKMYQFCVKNTTKKFSHLQNTQEPFASHCCKRKTQIYLTPVILYRCHNDVCYATKQLQISMKFYLVMEKQIFKNTGFFVQWEKCHFTNQFIHQRVFKISFYKTLYHRTLNNGTKHKFIYSLFTQNRHFLLPPSCTASSFP